MTSNRLEHVHGTTFHNRTRSDFRISFGVLNIIHMNLIILGVRLFLDHQIRMECPTCVNLVYFLIWETP